MSAFKFGLNSRTALPVLIGAGIVLGGGIALSQPAQAAVPGVETLNPPAIAGAKNTTIQLAMNHKPNPCAGKNPCNPCAGKNPCASKNPCNPCAGKNPCASKNPCAAKHPCNPCAPKRK